MAISSSVMSGLFLFSRRPAEAFNIVAVANAVRTIVNILKTYQNASSISRATFPFGGKITSSGVACKLNYWMTYPVPFPPFILIHPGVPIPLFGTKIDVSRPGLPTSNAYTLPYISKIYANRHENRTGVWTLGMAMNSGPVRQIISRINNALRSIVISIGVVTLFDFTINCPNGGLILKIGTS